MKNESTSIYAYGQLREYITQHPAGRLANNGDSTMYIRHLRTISKEQFTTSYEQLFPEEKTQLVKLLQSGRPEAIQHIHDIIYEYAVIDVDVL